MKTAIVLILAMAAQAVGNTCLTKGMKSIASLNQADDFSVVMLLRALETPMIWIGILCLLVFFAMFSASLSWADLSFVMPALSFGYIVNVACAAYFLGETVSRVRWAGTALIVAGVILVSKSGTGAAERAGAEPGDNMPG